VTRPFSFALITTLSAFTAFAQTDTAQAPRTAYVRRISVALRVSVVPLDAVSESTSQETLAVGPTAVSTTSDSKFRRLGGGLGVQLALSDRFAVNVDGLYRKFNYVNTTELRTGVDNPNTSADERTLRTVTKTVEASAWEFPVVIRRYSRSRFESGALWFMEVGGSLRRATKVQAFSESNGEITDAGTPVSKRFRPGVVGGFGVHLTDDFGIRVTPQVRYTYWLSRTIDDRPARSAVHQAEVIIGISF